METKREYQPVELMIVTPEDHARELQQNFDTAGGLLHEAYNLTLEVVPAAADKIAEAWEKINMVKQGYDERAAGLIAMLQKLEEQRNEQILLRQDLERELNDPHGSRHPQIVALIEKMREYADELAEDMKEAYVESYHDEIVEDAQEYIEESTLDSLADDIATELELDNSYFAHDLINLLGGRGNDGSRGVTVSLTPEEKESIIEWFHKTAKRLREDRQKVRAAIFDALNKKEEGAIEGFLKL